MPSFTLSTRPTHKSLQDWLKMVLMLLLCFVWTKKLISNSSVFSQAGTNTRLQYSSICSSFSSFSSFSIHTYPLYFLYIHRLLLSSWHSPSFWNVLLYHSKFMSIYYFEIQPDFTEFLFQVKPLFPSLSSLHICLLELTLFPIFPLSHCHYFFFW